MTARDSAGNLYAEFTMSDTEGIRVTWIARAKWLGAPTIRIQKRMQSGRLAPGPEFPAGLADAMVAAIREVARAD